MVSYNFMLLKESSISKEISTYTYSQTFFSQLKRANLNYPNSNYDNHMIDIN